MLNSLGTNKAGATSNESTSLVPLIRINSITNPIIEQNEALVTAQIPDTSGSNHSDSSINRNSNGTSPSCAKILNQPSKFKETFQIGAAAGSSSSGINKK